MGMYLITLNILTIISLNDTQFQLHLHCPNTDFLVRKLTICVPFKLFLNTLYTHDTTSFGLLLYKLRKINKELLTNYLLYN